MTTPTTPTTMCASRLSPLDGFFDHPHSPANARRRRRSLHATTQRRRALAHHRIATHAHDDARAHTSVGRSGDGRDRRNLILNLARTRGRVRAHTRTRTRAHARTHAHAIGSTRPSLWNVRRRTTDDGRRYFAISISISISMSMSIARIDDGRATPWTTRAPCASYIHTHVMTITPLYVCILEG